MGVLVSRRNHHHQLYMGNVKYVTCCREKVAQSSSSSRFPVGLTVVVLIALLMRGCWRGTVRCTVCVLVRVLYRGWRVLTLRSFLGWLASSLGFELRSCKFAWSVLHWDSILEGLLLNSEASDFISTVQKRNKRLVREIELETAKLRE